MRTSLLASLSALLRPMLEQPVRQIPIHGDCHIGNILWRDGPMLVDLDDCLMGPAIQDLWMLLSGEPMEQRYKLELLLEDYQQFCDFDFSQLQLIESLRSMRMVHYMAWLARRWSDPAFPLHFPWFNTDAYWQQQLVVLQNQSLRMQQPPLRLHPYDY